MTDLPISLVSPEPTGQQGPQKRATVPFISVVLAVALAACFVWVPWENVSGGGFPDRDNYIAAIDALLRTGARLFDFSDADVLSVLMNEYLWREVLLFIGGYFAEPLNGLLLISFFAAALTAFHVIRRAGVVYAMVFLLSPLSIDLFMSQTRSALAVGIFLSALAVRSAPLRYALFVAAFLFHSFAAILFAAYLFNEFLLARAAMGTRLKFSAVLLAALFASVIWAFLAQYVLGLIGDRRALQEAILPTSVAFALWWILLTFMLVAFARINSREGNAQYVMLAIFLQAMFVFSTLMGAGGLRFLSLSLPMVFIAIRSIRAPILRLAAMAGTIGFNLVGFSYWMS